MDLKQLDHQQAKKRMLVLRIISIAAVTCIVLSFGCIIAGTVLTDSAYHSFIDLSPTTAGYILKDSYLRAISLCPERPEAYLKLLDLYAEDGQFKKDESEEFLGIYNSNHKKLDKNTAGYSQIHSTVGYLYMSGYNAEITVCLKMALPFFELASSSIHDDDPNMLMVDCYNQMGTFYRDYIWNVSAAHREIAPEVMQNMIDHIEETIEAFRQNTSLDSIYDQLSFYTAACNLIYNQRDTLSATVEYEQVVGIIDAIYEALPDIDTLRREKIRNMVTEFDRNKNVYRIALYRAYKRTEEYEWK